MTDKNTSRNSFPPSENTLTAWLEAYFDVGTTASQSSQKVQRRDLGRFLAFVFQEEQEDSLSVWTPRLTRAFLEEIQQQTHPKTGEKRFGGHTIKRIFAHLKTFGRWIGKYKPFPLGNPVEGISPPPVIPLSVNRALTPSERRKMLDSADYLPVMGGKKRSPRKLDLFPADRPRRKAYRPWRNRAIIYTLVETGMRRSAITAINISGIDPTTRTIKTIEKGGKEKIYTISKTGYKAIMDYIHYERGEDHDYWDMSPALFLPACSRTHSLGRLSPRNINTIWNETRDLAKIEKKKTPHSARHGMGRYILDSTGNIHAVQKQLNHDSPYYSLQYAQLTEEEIQQVLDQRK